MAELERTRIDVRVFHTNDLRNAPYEDPGAIPVTEVYRYILTRPADAPSSDGQILDASWFLFNVGHEPEFTKGEPYPQAVDYRERRNRSLSIGDVVAISDTGNPTERFYQCTGGGWVALVVPPAIDPTGHEELSTPFDGQSPLWIGPVNPPGAPSDQPGAEGS